MSLCPCCSNRPFQSCCGPFLEGKELPRTPEELMRSRYTAFTQANVDYLAKTMRGIPKFDPEETRLFASRVQWLGLQVVKASMEDGKGQVEFIARYSEGGGDLLIHEISDFELIEGAWYYTGGEHLEDARKKGKVGRNDLCPCGSGKKYKNCCFK